MNFFYIQLKYTRSSDIQSSMFGIEEKLRGGSKMFESHNFWVWSITTYLKLLKFKRLESKEACRYFVTIINLCHPFALWASWVQSNPILCTHFGGPKNLKRFKSPLFISQNLVWGLYEGPWRRIFEWNTAHKTIIHSSKKFKRMKVFLSK